jgi:hypothetical protein
MLTKKKTLNFSFPKPMSNLLFFQYLLIKGACVPARTKRVERQRNRDDSGEQSTVVFALIVTEPASECVCVEWGGGVALSPPPRHANRFYNSFCKDDSALFSRFLHG